MTAIACLKVTLDDVEPAVLRRIEVPLTIALDRLHLTLQAAIGWTNSHLYEFRAQETGWGIPDPSWTDGPFDARKARLADLLEDTGAKRFEYLYDFGDGWTHVVKVERLVDVIPELTYPRLIEARGCCPPEDIGGPPGYADFLDALADPTHERHAELLEWVGGDFDPHHVDIVEHQRALDMLARKWAKGTRSKRAKLN